MASRFQRGCLRQENRKDGKVWKLRHYTVRPEDGSKVERTLFVGYVRDFPAESDAWREVNRQRLTEKINNPTLRRGKLTFRQIAEHYIDNDLLNPDVIKPKAQTTRDCYEHVIRGYLMERWGNEPAIGDGKRKMWRFRLSELAEAIVAKKPVANMHKSGIIDAGSPRQPNRRN